MLRILGENSTLAFRGVNQHSQTLVRSLRKDKHRGGEAPSRFFFLPVPNFAHRLWYNKL